MGFRITWCQPDHRQPAGTAGNAENVCGRRARAAVSRSSDNCFPPHAHTRNNKMIIVAENTQPVLVLSVERRANHLGILAFAFALNALLNPG